MQPRLQHRRPWPDPEPPELALTVPAGMRRERFRAMGTTISLLLPETTASVGTTLVRILFDQWEGTLSRFRPDSELSVLNRQAGRPVVVGDLLFQVIATAIDAAQATDGLFDPTLHHQMVQLGYDRSFDTLPLRVSRTLSVIRPGGGWQAIHLDHAKRRVTLPGGIGLDFGGIAKGMAVDAALAALHEEDVDAALVNAGGDLAVLGLPPGVEVWPIAVPLRQGSSTIGLQRGALATSGVARRRWWQGDEERHHLLDPRSGLPVQSGLWSVSVAAARCAQAEVAAKAAYLLGPAAGARFLQDRGLSGLLVEESGDRHAAGAWPAPASLAGAG